MKDDANAHRRCRDGVKPMQQTTMDKSYPASNVWHQMIPAADDRFAFPAMPAPERPCATAWIELTTLSRHIPAATDRLIHAASRRDFRHDTGGRRCAWRGSAPTLGAQLLWKDSLNSARLSQQRSGRLLRGARLKKHRIE